MSEHHLYVVLAVLLVPVDALLEVICPCALVFLCYRAIRRGILSEERVGCAGVTPLVEIHIINRCNGKSIRKCDYRSTRTVESVAFCIICIKEVGGNRVTLCKERTERRNSTVAIVVTYQARSIVVYLLAICIADVHWIDRRDICKCESIA